jgi:hypothetical protein
LHASHSSVDLEPRGVPAPWRSPPVSGEGGELDPLTREAIRAPRTRLRGQWLVAAACALSVLLLFPGAGPTHATAAKAHLVPAVLPEVTEFSVTGTVNGYSQSNATSTTVPIAGDTVSVVPANCTPIFNASGACTPTEVTTTNSSGEYSLTLSNGSYYLYSSPRGAWGGDTKSVKVNGTSVSAPALDAFDELSYSNSTFVLPGFSQLSGYVDDHSATQVPVLSYASDGVYYVNASNDLVYYSFPNETVRFIAPWDMLYDQIGYVGELNNYFYLTFDGSYAYELGCAVAGCGGNNLLIEYAVNITTGRSFTWNTGITQKSTSANAGVNLVGRDGNDSLMTLLTANGTIRLFNPWNGTAWNAGHLAYFEANNVYWVPFWSSYVNIQAEGSSLDQIEQLELEGPGSGTSFVPVYGPHVNGPGGIKSNGVNGLVFNLTLNEMAYDYGSAASGNVQTAYSFSDGILTNVVSYALDKSAPAGRVLADDHRLSVTTGAPVVNAYYDPDFYNQSWATDPFSGQFFDTNIQEGYRAGPAQFDSAAGFDGEPAHQFLNATSAITAFSVNCANATGVALPCPLLGTTGGTTLGTVYYVSALHGGQFPYPASAPIAQPFAPPAPTVSPSATAATITLNWTAPPDYPILNYTLYWGPGPTTLLHQLNLAPQVHQYTFSGLSPGEQVYYGLTATDLHFVSPMTLGSAMAVVESGPAAPTGLRAVTAGAHEVDLTWTNPPGTLVNDTLYFATDAAGPFSGLSEGVTTSVALGILGENTTYYFDVTAWNATGESPTSNEASATTLGPPAAARALSVTATTPSSVQVAWEDPPGAIANTTLYYAPAGRGPFAGISVGAMTSALVSGLSPVTTYYFEVAVWNAVGQGPRSNEVSATTTALPPPSAPTDLVARAVNATAILLSWTPPSGTLLNYTAAVGVAPGAWSTYYNVADGAVSNYTVSALSPSTTYFFVVWAWSSSGGGVLSHVANATTLPAPSAGTPRSIPGIPLLGIGAALIAAISVFLYFTRRPRRGK